MLDAEGVFTGLCWLDAKPVAAAICFDICNRDNAADFLRNRARNVLAGTDNMPAPGTVDYNQLDAVPAVIRRNRASTVEALQQSGVDKYDIPAFLRKQAD